MAGQRQLLLDLITGRARPGVKAASASVSLAGLLRGQMRKQAQIYGGTALGEASKNWGGSLTKSVTSMHTQRQQAAAAAAARRNAPKRGFTGDAAYDNLPDVQRRRMHENLEAARKAYFASRPDLVQRKSQAEIQKEVGPVKSWGDNKWVRRGATALSVPMQAVMHGVGRLMGDKPREGGFWAGVMHDARGAGYDAANNVQMLGNATAHGVGTVARGVNYGAQKYLLGASKDKLYSLDNAWDNANAAYKAEQDAIQGNFREKDLRDPNSTLGKFNRAFVDTTGEALGQTAALGAVGGAAGAVGRGISAGTRVLSGAVHGTQAARTAAQATAAGSRAAGWGARAVQGARNMAANGIDYVGDSFAMPFRAANRAIMHPVGSARSAASSMANAVRHPLRALGSDTLWKAYGGYDTWSNLARGDMGGAAGSVGDMMALGGLGKLYLPAMAAQGVYGMMQGGDDGDDGGYPYPYGE